jgi:hypothetical protein
MESRISARPAVVVSSVLVVIVGLGSASVFAQSPLGPRAASAPSYGPPPSPLLLGYGTRTMTPVSLSLSVTVPAASLTSILPPGFTALPLAADPTRTQVNILMSYKVNTQLVNPVVGTSILAGTYGPYNGMTISASVLNSTGQTQVFALAGYANNQELVDIDNAAVGAGSTRYADIDFTLKDVDGVQRVHVVARDPETGLVVNVEANASPVVTSQTRNFGPFVSQSLALGDPATVLGAAFVGISSDNSVVLPEQLDVQAVKLKFVSGKITDVVPLGASMSWNTEGFFKRLP